MADIITQLKAMDDASLMKKIGFADKLQKFRTDLDRADKLTGDARNGVIAEINKAFTPSSYVIEDLGWRVDSAERKAAKLAKGASDFVNECGCCASPEMD